MKLVYWLAAVEFVRVLPLQKSLPELKRERDACEAGTGRPTPVLPNFVVRAAWQCTGPPRLYGKNCGSAAGSDARRDLDTRMPNLRPRNSPKQQSVRALQWPLSAPAGGCC